MAKERRSINEVIDRPAITAARLLVGITTIAVCLVAYMGDRVIKNQDTQLREISNINGSLKVYEVSINRNTKDISELDKKFTLKDKETNLKVNGINQRLYNVERKR